MGSDASVPQEEPLIPQNATPQTLPNGTDPPVQPIESTTETPIEAGSDPKTQIESKSQAPTTAVAEPEVETRSTEMKESTSDPNKDTASNPYIGDNLAVAQKEFHPEKNKKFEQEHAVSAESIKSVDPKTAPSKPVTVPPAVPTKPKPTPKKVVTKSTYQPEKPSMEVKRKIEDYFHTSYPINITEDVFKTNTDLIKIRRYFHVNPELSFQEFKTAAHIARYCETLGLVTKKNVGRTGVVAVLHGEFSDGPCIALRADMDALPIQELNTFDYKSRVDDVMHACGHDCHMAILLTVARVLSMPKYVKQLHGCVRFIFQPAEEGGAGAKYMIQDGVLKEDNETLNCPEVDEVYGLHVWSYSKLGKIVLKSGVLMAGALKWKISVKGSGGHGAEPKGTRDAVLALTQLSIQLHSIVSRDLSPIESGVLTIGTIEVGDAANIIAENGRISGTMRYLGTEIFDTIKRRMIEICKGIETSYGVQTQIEWGDDPYPPVVNHKENVENVRGAVKAVFPEMDNVIIDTGGCTMAAEDFSFYLNEKPGCFFFLGCGVDENEGDHVHDHENGGCGHGLLNKTPQRVLQNIEDGDEKKTKIYAHHTPNFKVDERCLIVGVQIMVNLVMGLLTKSEVEVDKDDVKDIVQGMNGTLLNDGNVIEDKMIGDSQ